MATVPVTRTWVAGEVVLASHFNTNIRDVLQYLLAPPIFEGRQIVAQSFTTAVAAGITMTAEDIDSSGMHSTVSNTDRVTAVYPGWYEGGGGNSFASNATGARGSQWSVNGTVVNGSRNIGPTLSGAAWAGAARVKKMFCNVNDIMRLEGLQTSGGNLNSDVTAELQPNVSIKWISN